MLSSVSCRSCKKSPILWILGFEEGIIIYPVLHIIAICKTKMQNCCTNEEKKMWSNLKFSCMHNPCKYLLQHCPKHLKNAAQNLNTYSSYISCCWRCVRYAHVLSGACLMQKETCNCNFLSCPLKMFTWDPLWLCWHRSLSGIWCSCLDIF